MAKTSSLTFQTQSWGFDEKKITVGDETAENYSIPIAPGTSGIIPLTVDNSGEDAETVQIGVTISKFMMDTEENPEMEEELQKRIFFYADTDKTYTFDAPIEGDTSKSTETVSKIYLGSSAPENYTYTVLPGQKLTMNEIFYNDVPLKWEWVYDMLGYYFRGTVTGASESSAGNVAVDEYIRPIEYDYDYDQPVFNDKGQLETVKGMKAIDFLKEISANDGYEDVIHSSEAVTIEVEVKNADTTETETKTQEQIYYPVEVDENGYGVWAYLCTKDEILEGIAYDTALANADTPVSVTVTIVLTANTVPAKITEASTEQEFLKALADENSNIVALKSDISLENPVNFESGNKILDLNGYGISYRGSEESYGLIQVKTGAALTVVNGDITGNSTATTAGAMNKRAFQSQGGNLVLSDVNVTGFDTAVYIEDMNAETAGDSTVQITNCTLETAQPTLVLQGNGEKTDAKTKVIIQGSTLSSKYYSGISGQGNQERWGTELIISESSVTGCYCGIYFPQSDSVTTITESKISGNTGIALKGGSMTIHNSEIVGTGEIAVDKAGISNSGFIDTGDAIYVEAGYNWSATVIVKGENTKVISKKANAAELFGESGKGPGKILLYDGTYSSDAEGGASAKWNDIGTFEIYGGTFEDSVSDTITRYDMKTAADSGDTSAE